MGNYSYPTKEELYEAISLDKNLNILEENEDYIVVEDMVQSFLAGKKCITHLNLHSDIEKILFVDDEQKEYLIEQHLSNLPDILLLSVKNIIIDDDAKSENPYYIKDGVVCINTVCIENSIKKQQIDDVFDFDFHFKRKLFKHVTEALFSLLSKNSLFFDEFSEDSVDYEKYLAF